MLKKNINRLNFSIFILFKNTLLNLIGTISVLEILIVFKIPSLISYIKNAKIKELNKITTICLLIFLSQVFSEIMVDNQFLPILKGLATTFFFFFVFLFFFRLLVKDINLIAYYPLITIVSIFIFGDQFNYASHDGDTFFKFYIAPIILQLFLFIVLLQIKVINKYLIPISISVALIIIVGGARTIGFSLFLSSFLFNSFRKGTIKKRGLPIFKILGSVLIIYLFLVLVYIPKLQSNEWGSAQNRKQLKISSNVSSNPLLLLASARPDFFVTLQAFIDKPYFGHGSWAVDKNKKYKKQLLELVNEKFNSKSSKEISHIPVHSIILSMGAQHGIIKFILFLVLVFYVFSISMRSLKKTIPLHLKYYLSYIIISTSFILLFSPITVLKNHVAISFSYILALHIIVENNLSINSKIN